MRNWWVVSGACLWEWCFSVVMFAHIARVEVAARMGELNPGRPTVLVCAAGVRSVYAIETVRAAGYPWPASS